MLKNRYFRCPVLVKDVELVGLIKADGTRPRSGGALVRGRRRGGKRHRWKKHGRGEINLRPRRKEVGFRFLSVGGR